MLSHAGCPLPSCQSTPTPVPVSPCLRALSLSRLGVWVTGLELRTVDPDRTSGFLSTGNGSVEGADLCQHLTARVSQEQGWSRALSCASGTGRSVDAPPSLSGRRPHARAAGDGFSNTGPGGSVPIACEPGGVSGALVQMAEGTVAQERGRRRRSFTAYLLYAGLGSSLIPCGVGFHPRGNPVSGCCFPPPYKRLKFGEGECLTRCHTDKEWQG